MNVIDMSYDHWVAFALSTDAHVRKVEEQQRARH